jgi:hypothetical protein
LIEGFALERNDLLDVFRSFLKKSCGIIVPCSLDEAKLYVGYYELKIL